MPPLIFAHRGAPEHRREANTARAFERALAAGARGLESDVWLTRDGVPVMYHPHLWREPRRVGAKTRAQLADSVLALDEFYARCGAHFDLALDLGGTRTAARVVEVAREHGAADRLWLTSVRVRAMAAWRASWPEVHLVHPTIIWPGRSVDQLCARLRAAGVAALNLHQRQITRQRVDAAHAAGLLFFAWGARTEEATRRVLAQGADGVFTDDLRGLVRVMGGLGSRADGPTSPGT